jgi:hypothetical protein
MKKRDIIIIVILGLLICSNIYWLIQTENFEKEKEHIEDVAFDFGYEIANWYALHTNKSDFSFQEFIGEIYSIEYYTTMNSTGGYYLNNEFKPYSFDIYTLHLDLRGFFSGQSFSPYVNPEGKRDVSFRLCKTPITQPGQYKFYYFDSWKGYYDITHWEKI